MCKAAVCKAVAGTLFGTILCGTFFLGFLVGRADRGAGPQKTEAPTSSR